MTVAAKLPKLFEDLAESAADAIEALIEAESFIVDMREVRQYFAEQVCPHIDYDRYGPAFTYQYFLENFWKASYAFNSVPIGTPRSIVDIGTGSGATILAFLATLSSQSGGHFELDVTLVDRSSVQLRLARQIMQKCAPLLTNLRINVKAITGEVLGLTSKEGVGDVVLLGHVFNENATSVELLWKKALSYARPASTIYVLERQDDLIWPVLLSHVTNRLCLPGVTTNVRGILPVRRQHMHRSPDRETIRCRLLAVDVPLDKRAPDLLSQYFDAWRSGSVSALADVFTEDATYFEKPFERPFKGLAEIQQYWASEVVPQYDRTITIKTVAYSRTWAFAEWQCVFFREKVRYDVRGALIVKLHPEISRISELVEYFRAEKVTASVRPQRVQPRSKDD